MRATIASPPLKWIKAKAAFLLVPHAIFNVLYYFASATGVTIYEDATQKFTFLQWLKEAFLVNSGEWFLWVLFVIFMFLLLIYRVERQSAPPLFWMVTAVVAALLLLFPEFGKTYLRIYEIQWYFLFAMAGYLLAKYKTYTLKLNSVMVLLAVVYPVLLYMSIRLSSDAFFPLHSFNYYFDLYPRFFYLLRFMLAASGICLVYLLSIALKRVNHLSQVLAWLGRMTIGIYLFHMLFPGLHLWSGWFAIASSFIISLSLSILLTLISAKIPIVNRNWLKSPAQGQ
jgi:hypothetical protein